QALVIVVLVVGIAAASVVGLRAAQDRVAAVAREQRAGEAAVEAAAASLADAYVAQVAAAGARASESPRSTPDVPRLLADPRVIQAARMAAADVARANDARPTDSLEATCSEGRVEARLTLRGYPHRAAFAAPECSRR